MNSVIAVFVTLIEILMILQFLQITFQQDLRFDKYMAGVILTDLVVYRAIQSRVLPILFTVIVHIVIFIYSYRTFKRSIKITIVRLIIAYALVTCTEAVLFSILTCFIQPDNAMLLTIVTTVIGLLVTILIKKLVRMVGAKRILASNKGIYVCIIFCGLIIITVLGDYYFFSGTITVSVLFLLVLVVLILFCLYRLEQANNEIARKNYELEVQRVYGGAYEELLREVRRRQHDYKNQLGAIYSMHLVANSLEELADMQKEYMDGLKSDSKYDSILTRCSNAILAGYLYHRCISCEQEGVEVDYDIQVGQAQCSFAIHEIIEILGVLIDNACENFAVEQEMEKCIKLEFKEEEDRIMFSVANPAKHMSFAEISNMFTRGYSSKGENRGIGLARVQELVNQREAELKVTNVSYDETNWLRFAIEIEKKNT